MPLISCLTFAPSIEKQRFLMIKICATTMMLIAGATASAAPPPLATATEVYALSERCAKSAAETWKIQYKGINKEKGVIATYENHYSLAKNRCYFKEIITTVKKDSTVMLESLFDLNDNKQIGGMQIFSGKLVGCQVLSQKCNSQIEWGELLTPYMDN